MFGGENIVNIYYKHRRRRNTGEKTNVVTAVWGPTFIQVLATPAILHKDGFEDWNEFILFVKPSWCNSYYSSTCPSAQQLARQGIE